MNGSKYLVGKSNFSKNLTNFYLSPPTHPTHNLIITLISVSVFRDLKYKRNLSKISSKKHSTIRIHKQERKKERKKERKEGRKKGKKERQKERSEEKGRKERMKGRERKKGRNK